MRKRKPSMPEAQEPLTQADAQCMAQIYRKYYGNMKRAVLGLLSGPDVEDIIQETVLRMMRSIEKWRGLTENQMYAYTCHAARNHAIDYLRAHQKEPYLQEKDPEEEEWSNGLDARLIREEQIGMLYQILDRLSDRDRDLLIMKYWQHLSDWEIAARLEVKPTSVSGLVSRARKRVLALAEKEGMLRDE